MDRETKIITTPVEKHEVEIYSYITGREKRALTNVFLSGNLSFNMDNKDIQGLRGNLVEQAEDLAFRTIIKEVDKHKEGDLVNGKPFSIVETVLNMHAGDYAFVVSEVNKISEDKGFEEKKIA